MYGPAPDLGKRRGDNTAEPDQQTSPRYQPQPPPRTAPAYQGRDRQTSDHEPRSRKANKEEHRGAHHRSRQSARSAATTPSTLAPAASSHACQDRPFGGRGRFGITGR